MEKKLFVMAIILLLSLPIFNISIGRCASRPRVDWAVLISGTNLGSGIPDELTREPLRNCYYMLHILTNDWGVPRNHIKFLHIRPELVEWPVEEIVPPETIDANCTIDDVNSTINDWLKPNCKSTDNALIFITTHGGGWNTETNKMEGGRIDDDDDEEGDGVDECLVFIDYFRAVPKQRYWDDDFNETLKGLSYNQLVICLTMCFSGGFIDDLSANNRIIITSSSETSETHFGSSENEPGFTLFTGALLDALHGHHVVWNKDDVHNRIVDENDIWIPDLDCNGVISWREAYIYAKDKYNINAWFDGNGNRLPTYKDGRNYAEYSLFIWCSGGGHTIPSHGEHEYLAGTTVSVQAVPLNSNYEFDHWFPDDLTYIEILYSIYPTENPYEQLMDDDHTLKAYFHRKGSSDAEGPDSCPKLYTWNGNGYVDYGVIDIHNPTGEDVVKEVSITKEDLAVEGFKAKLRLQEGWLGLEYSHSEIDQVKLYALDSYGNRLPCPPTKATYNNYNLRPTLVMSDDIKLGIYLLERVDLEFIVPYQNIQGFAFVIEGCNMLKY
jgi:hypothetical protein